MMNKLINTVVILLFIALAVQSIYGTYTAHKSAAVIEQLHQYQEDKLTEKATEIQAKEDSLAILVVTKSIKIKRLENRLKTKLKNAKVNNEKFKQDIKRAKSVTNTDSLTDALSNRYKER